jgi:hypothetical protein
VFYGILLIVLFVHTLLSRVFYHDTHILALLSQRKNKGRLPASGKDASHPESHVDVFYHQLILVHMHV